jgi:hypothetical protein
VGRPAFRVIEVIDLDPHPLPKIVKASFANSLEDERGDLADRERQRGTPPILDQDVPLLRID